MALRRLLLIENERKTREALHGTFIRMGWEVAMVLTRAEGLNLLLDYDPHWIITASSLPDGDAEAVLRKVRDARRKTRVAIVTASKDPAHLSHLSGLKPDLLLQEPVDSESVYRLCEAAAKPSKATG
jgi:DNA-binding response OmpR family regulator